jgi:anhydro-N-acetylmuramic acid kinase
MSDIHQVKFAGIMSGTSLDGLDIAICSFPEPGKFEIHAAQSYPFTKILRKQLKKAHTLSGEDLVRFDFEFGHFIGKKILELENDLQIKADIISSHGHTVFHTPGEGITWQIGHPSAIAAQVERPVIADFRTQDTASGGQGAPLVPIGDRDLFSEYDGLLNLGGIANLTFYVGETAAAYDVCPCNLLFNSMFKKGRFDEGGQIARKGNSIPEMLKDLNSLKYLTRSGSKSLGREDVEEDIWPIVEDFMDDYKRRDILRTYSDFIAEAIAGHLNNKCSNVLVTGGGAYNSFLIENINSRCENVKITVPGSEIVEFKEALVFAYLGYLRFQEKVNILKSVTGGRKDRSGGAICLG